MRRRASWRSERYSLAGPYDYLIEKVLNSGNKIGGNIQNRIVNKKGCSNYSDNTKRRVEDG